MESSYQTECVQADLSSQVRDPETRFSCGMTCYAHKVPVPVLGDIEHIIMYRVTV